MLKYNTIDEYIDAQSHLQAERLQELRKAILEAVPNAIETFNYGVPAFSLVQNGKRDQQIMIGAFKNHVGIYPHPTTIVEFEKELSQFDQGISKTIQQINERLGRNPNAIPVEKLLEYFRTYHETFVQLVEDLKATK